jgi:hypothetical protein
MNNQFNIGDLVRINKELPSKFMEQNIGKYAIVTYFREGESGYFYTLLIKGYDMVVSYYIEYIESSLTMVNKNPNIETLNMLSR